MILSGLQDQLTCRGSKHAAVLDPEAVARVVLEVPHCWDQFRQSLNSRVLRWALITVIGDFVDTPSLNTSNRFSGAQSTQALEEKHTFLCQRRLQSVIT